MTFDNNYAEFYDLLYQTKDYNKEARYIDTLIKRNLGDYEPKILDLACGTGKHAFELERMGYSIDGSDISNEMIKLAQKRALDLKSNIKFYNYSFQESNNINAEYDVVISMFSAVNYLTSFEDISRSLTNMHGLLKSGGLLIFDYWNGNAVIRDYSPLKILRRKNEKGELIRISETALNLTEQIAEVKFTCMYFKDEIKQLEFEELHRMRYFYFSELENLLKSHGFRIKFRSSFLNEIESFDPHDWNISIVAERLS